MARNPSGSSPTVSVITPVYNQERYVQRCIESVLAQSFEDWEQIVVDDGSDDRTEELVRAYADPRIHYLRLPHRGLAALGDTYNAALAKARGRLVAVLEGDDSWPSDKLEKQVPVFDREEVFLSWGRGALIDAEGRVIGERATLPGGEPRRYLDRREIFRRLVLKNVLAPTVTVMVRRSALDAIGGFKQTGSALYVDLPTWLWLTASTEGRVCYLDEVIGCYRVYPEQTTHRQKSRFDSEYLGVLLELERVLGRARLEEAGLTRVLHGRAVQAGMIVEGRRHVAERRFGAAAGAFGRALLRTRDPRDAAKALVGLASALLRRDLLGAAYAWRESAVTGRRRS